MRFHMRHSLLAFAIALACCMPATAPAAPALRLLSEEFAPVNFSENGVGKGLSVEIVREIQQRLGGPAEIEFMPWSRAYREAQGREPVALFAMARTPAREKLFKWAGPIVTFYSSIYAPNGDGVRLRSLNDAKKVKAVLVVRDWYTGEQLSTQGFKNLVPVSDPVQGIKMLQARRAPLFATERITMPQIMAQAGVPADAFEVVYSFASSEGYIAFSLATPDATVKAWQQQLDAMKQDGRFLAIYKRWLPNDNPPLGKR